MAVLLNLHLLSVYAELQYNKYADDLGLLKLQSMTCCGEQGSPLKECGAYLLSKMDAICLKHKKQFIKKLFSDHMKGPLKDRENQEKLLSGHAHAVMEVLGGHPMSITNVFDVQDAIARAWEKGDRMGTQENSDSTLKMKVDKMELATDAEAEAREYKCSRRQTTAISDPVDGNGVETQQEAASQETEDQQLCLNWMDPRCVGLLASALRYTHEDDKNQNHDDCVLDNLLFSKVVVGYAKSEKVLSSSFGKSLDHVYRQYGTSKEDVWTTACHKTLDSYMFCHEGDGSKYDLFANWTTPDAVAKKSKTNRKLSADYDVRGVQANVRMATFASASAYTILGQVADARLEKIN